MTAQISPWSVKGVEPEAREAAKMAARKAGVPIGVWLTQTVLAAASGELKNNGAPGRTAGLPTTIPPAGLPDVLREDIQKLKSRCLELEERLAETVEPLTRKIRRMGEQFEEIESAQEKTRVLLRQVENIQSLGDVEAKLKGLDEIPHIVQQAIGQKIADQSTKLRDVSRELEELKRTAGAAAPASLSAAPLERALTRLADRIQKLEDEKKTEKKGGLF